MNKYGLIAQEHWQKYAPNRYAKLEDPGDYFADLGESISNEVTAIIDHLEQSLPKDLPFLEMYQERMMIQKQAEEKVLAEAVYSLEIETTSLEELDDLLGELPTIDGIQRYLEQIERGAEDIAELEGWENALYTDEEHEIWEWAGKIIPLLDKTRQDFDHMTEAEAEEKLLELRALPHPRERYY